MTYHTYRAAFWTDGDGEIVLTGPEHSHLPEDELLEEARAEAERGDVDLSIGSLVVGDWTEQGHPASPEPPTGDEIRAWRSRMGWTQEVASRALGLSRGHLADLETGTKSAKGYLRLAMERLESLQG